MENILDETSVEIVIELERLGIRLGTWEQDAIRRVLTAAFARCFEKGRAAGLSEVIGLLKK